MEFPVLIRLHPSRFLQFFPLLPALLIIIQGIMLPHDPLLRFLAICCALLIALRGLFFQPPAVGQLSLQRDGSLAIRVDGQADLQRIELLSGVTAHPWLCILPYRQANGRAGRLVITVDSANKQDLRRLRLWLRQRKETLKLPCADA